MSETSAQDFLNLVNARKGHFRLESGHHSESWLDLDHLFVDPARVAPLVDELARALRAYELDAICGPLVGGAFLALMLSASLDLEFLFTERRLPEKRQELYGVEYHLPRALRDRVRGKRVAIVDDAISAGSAARGTYAELKAHGAELVAVGALMVLGSLGADFFTQERVSVTSVARLPFDVWPPAECPLCVRKLPIEDRAA